jgi:hypothetical protein
MSMVKIVLELLNMEVKELITAENITTINSPRNPAKHIENSSKTSEPEQPCYLSVIGWFNTIHNTYHKAEAPAPV